jgi:lipopolysaccharide transport system permease protein
MSTETTLPLERRWVENRATSGLWPQLQLHELWAYRDVALILAHRDLKVRYKQTFFGITWALIQPLLAMALFTLILRRGAGIPSDGVPYAPFALAGLAIWFPFNTALAAAADSLVRDPELVTKVYFPRLLAPLGAVLAPIADLVVALIIAFIVTAISGVALTPAVALLPLCAIATIVVAIAFGLWLSALNVLYRDVRYALGFVIQLLFFASPVVYPGSLIDGRWSDVLALNPLVGLIDVTRFALLGTPADVTAIAISAGATLVMLATGLVFFRRVERQFADRI